MGKSDRWSIERGLVCECDIKNIFCTKPDKYKLFDLNPEKKIRNHFFSFENDTLNKSYTTNHPFEISLDFIKWRIEDKNGYVRYLFRLNRKLLLLDVNLYLSTKEPDKFRTIYIQYQCTIYHRNEYLNKFSQIQKQLEEYYFEKLKDNKI